MFYLDVDYKEWGGTFGDSYNTTESYGEFYSVEEAEAFLHKIREKYEFEQNAKWGASKSKRESHDKLRRKKFGTPYEFTMLWMGKEIHLPWHGYGCKLIQCNVVERKNLPSWRPD